MPMSNTKSRRTPNKAELLHMVKWYGFCYICGEKLNGDVEFDHEKELWEGGDNSEENFKPAHKACHQKKTAEKTGLRTEIKHMRGDVGQRSKKNRGKGFYKSPMKSNSSMNNYGGGFNSRNSFDRYSGEEE